MPPRLSGAPVVTKRAKPLSRVATREALCVRAAALCRGLSTPRMPLRRGPLGLSGGERAGPQTYLSTRFVRSTSVPPVLVQVFREADARAGADAQQACRGKACGSQQGREEAAGAFGPPTAARQGGGRRRPGCRESRAVAGLQRGLPGRWGVLETKSHAGGVCLLAGPPKCPVTVREQPGESVAVDKCGGGSQGRRLGHRAGRAGGPEESPHLIRFPIRCHLSKQRGCAPPLRQLQPNASTPRHRGNDTSCLRLGPAQCLSPGSAATRAPRAPR